MRHTLFARMAAAAAFALALALPSVAAAETETADDAVVQAELVVIEVRTAGDGFCADIEVRSQASDPSRWIAPFDPQGTVVSIWDAVMSRGEDGSITVAGAGSTSTISAANPVTFGYCAQTLANADVEIPEPDRPQAAVPEADPTPEPTASVEPTPTPQPGPDQAPEPGPGIPTIEVPSPDSDRAPISPLERPSILWAAA